MGFLLGFGSSWQLTTVCNLSPRGSDTLTQTQTDRHAGKMPMYIKIINYFKNKINGSLDKSTCHTSMKA